MWSIKIPLALNINRTMAVAPAPQGPALLFLSWCPSPQCTVKFIEQRQSRFRLTTRRPQAIAVFGIKLRKRYGRPFFHKFVQTHAPSARKCLEPLMFGIR